MLFIGTILALWKSKVFGVSFIALVVGGLLRPLILHGGIGERKERKNIAGRDGGICNIGAGVLEEGTIWILGKIESIVIFMRVN